MTAAEVLERAAELIDKRGHCKNIFADRSGALCAMGAVSTVMTGQPDADLSLLGWAAPTLGLRRAIGPVADWNDAPQRTKDEVTSTMRAVAATLRAAETQREMTSETERNQAQAIGA